MKLRYNIFYTVVVGLLFLSCSHFEEVEPEQLKPVEKVQMTLTAHMDMEEPMTKTYLAGDPVASSRYTYWLPADEIGVLSLSLNKFTNTSADTSAVAVFEGKSELASRYYAIYPYPDQTFQSAGDGKLIFNIPAVQKYQKKTFATDVVPMVTKFKSGEELYFKNACGGLVIKVKGVEKIKSMRLVAYEQTGVEAKIAGQCLVDMNAEEYVITPEISASTSISIDCGSGVQLNESEPVAFHFALAPATYHGFRVVMMSEDGKFMVKETDKELNIKRANITYAAPFSFEESESVDLSLRGTSNCYVISEANRYRFNASVIGNGTYGIVPDVSFHTSDPSISPVSVKVLWESTGANVKAAVGDIVSDVILKDGYVYFLSTGKEGNALIAVKDADGNILWSWHIWVTDMPADQTYVNSAGTFVVQDRNLGAVRADQGNGDEYKESHGLVYQWGRKDPFIRGYYTKENSAISIEESIVAPAVFSVWSPWMTPENHGLWDSSMKTIYDPCPVGYVINSDSVWESFKNQTVTNIGNGWELAYDGANKTWIPAAAWIDTGGTLITRDYEVYMWSGKYDKNLHINNSSLGIGGWQLNNGFTVRCMKDENYIDPLYASMVIKEIGDVTGSSVTVVTTITHTGKTDITSRGVVYGTVPTVTVENGVKVESTDNALEFVTQITGMEMATKYYVRAYAINEAGIAYSNPVSFHTLYEGEGINLSEDGTANSYIVPPIYAAYTFDCTVKGNSTESVGEAASAEVIWETKNTLDAVSLGEIIPSVELLDGKVKFMLPFEPVHGNALIAVKDAAGTIIWSWHIWVTDYDPETDADLYASGAKMMDRNLGALNDNARGFYYQWGRKDPLTHKNIAITAPDNIIQYIDKSDAINTLDYAVSHPNHFIKSSSWNDDASLWAVTKTMYDPCPQGYRVPENDMWTGWQSSGYIFPDTGCIESSNPQNLTNSSHIFFWLTDKQCIKERSNLVGGNISDALPVRCMKDADIIPVTLSSSNITEEGATLNGKLTINDNTVIEEMGFVVSKTSSDISVSNENCTKLIVDNTTGEFSTNATGLVPNTTYYFRAFAKGGYNIKYGDVMEFRTHSMGISDDFTGDDYVWE